MMEEIIPRLRNPRFADDPKFVRSFFVNAIKEMKITFDPESREAVVTWSARPGRIYSLEFSDDLELWSDIDDNIVASAEEMSFPDVVPAAVSARAYRIREVD